MDVINGPLAVAGSNFNLSNTNGKDIPIKLPTMTITIIVKATTTATSKPPRTTPITENTAAIITPIKAATESSLVNILNQSLSFTSRVVSAQRTRVADREPALPPLSINNGKKNTNATF